MEREGDWKTSFQTQPKTKPLHDGTLVPLPSDLMIWVCSHFHSDRKGTMRKIKEAARKKNKSDEDCYRPPATGPISLSYFHWDIVDKNLWMQSSCILQMQQMLSGASLTVQGAQAVFALLILMASLPHTLYGFILKPQIIQSQIHFYKEFSTFLRRAKSC